MEEIPIGKIGQILESKNPAEKDWFVKVTDDSEKTGGFLIFISSNNEFSKWGEVFDAWVETKGHIANYFENAGWRVQW